MRIAVLLMAIMAGLIVCRYKPEWTKIVLFVWVASVIWQAFLIRTPVLSPRYYLDLFHAVKLFMQYRCSNPKYARSFLEGAILNILLFIPAGFLLPVAFKRLECCWKTILIGVVLSLGIEFVQLFTHLGIFDLDDLMNNTIGTWIGLNIYKRIIQTKQTDKNEKQ